MEILILAAGLGSRFFSKQAKIKVNFWGKRVIDVICDKAVACQIPVSVVIREDITLEHENINKITQKSGYGTGIAVLSYIESKQELTDVLIVPGDSPLIEIETLQKFLEINSKSDLIIGVMRSPIEQEKYGRIIKDNGKIKSILEYKKHPDKTEYINTGIIYLSKKALALVCQLQKNDDKEIYLTDIVNLAYEQNFTIDAVELDSQDALGFNTVEEFHSLLKIAQQKWRLNAIKSGAIFLDINSVYLSYDTKFEAGCVIEPFCRFLPNVSIAATALVQSFCVLENCQIAGIVGPFAHINSSCVAQNAQVGAFVQAKNSQIAKNSKIKHLTYLGDVEIGENVNVGAGVVICNYDGISKHKTTIKNNAFIGSNSALISPLIIGESSFLAAGGVYTNNVEDNEFSIARAKQTNKTKK